MSKKINVIHLITSLEGGGAESMLYKLLQHSDQKKYDISVVSMLDSGVYGERIKKDLSIPVYELKINGLFSGLKGIYKLTKLSKSTNVIQTWMYHANLLGFISAKILQKKIIWGIHHNDLSSEKNKRTTILIAKSCAYISKWVDNVVYCGPLVKKNHLSIGYDKKNGIVIPNGFDVKVFSPNLKTVLSKELDFEENKNVLIHVGRWDPLKDYENLIESLHHLKILRKDFMALLVGKEISYENSHLVELIKKYDLDSYVKLLGRREDVPKLMASADLFISSSSNEGFPNVIGEAMASETYCVVTDAGDSSSLIGNEGKIVKVKSPKDLANALGESLSMSSEELQIASEKARKRIIDNFTIEYATNEYQKLYEINY